MIPIQERNAQILQLRKEGRSRQEVSRRFRLSPSRILLLERQDAADRAMAERCSKLREALRAADDPIKLWPINDLIDCLELVAVTRKRLLDYLCQSGVSEISLSQLMAMCLDRPADLNGFTTPTLLRVSGIGKRGFWSVVNGLTDMDLGTQCNGEWLGFLAHVKRRWRITGRTPYSCR